MVGRNTLASMGVEVCDLKMIDSLMRLNQEEEKPWVIYNGVDIVVYLPKIPMMDLSCILLLSIEQSSPLRLIIVFLG